jgi:hypothetical protein
VRRLTEEEKQSLREGELKLWHVFWLLNRFDYVETLPWDVNESHQETLSFLPKEEWPHMNVDTDGILTCLVQMLAKSIRIKRISKLWEAHFPEEKVFFSTTVGTAETFHQKSIDDPAKTGTEASTEFTTVSHDQVSTDPGSASLTSVDTAPSLTTPTSQRPEAETNSSQPVSEWTGGAK